MPPPRLTTLVLQLTSPHNYSSIAHHWSLLKLHGSSLCTVTAQWPNTDHYSSSIAHHCSLLLLYGLSQFSIQALWLNYWLLLQLHCSPLVTITSPWLITVHHCSVLWLPTICYYRVIPHHCFLFQLHGLFALFVNNQWSKKSINSAWLQVMISVAI